MKKIGLFAFFIANSSAFALNPVQGLYGGILLGVNATHTAQFTFPSTFTIPSPTSLTIPADTPFTLNYGHMGQIAGQGGYRCGKFRIEGQIGYNGSPYNSLQINDLTLSNSDNNAYNFEGSTNTLYGMINGYFDVMPIDPESNLVPFIGIGIGYASTKNTLQMDLYSDQIDGVTVPGYQVGAINVSETTTSPAAQAMIGASYFLDDFSAFSLDLRYLTTQKKSDILNARVEVLSLNLTFNGAFDVS